MKDARDSTPSPTPPSPPGRRKRRWPRRVAYALLALVALLVLLVAGALLYASTGPGEARIRAVALDQANEALQGKIAWEKLDARGNHLVLHGLKLFDPEGNLVAEIDTVDLTVSLRALARGELVASQARIVRPRLYLVQDERGLNLMRALAAKKPSLPSQPSEPSRLFVRVDHLSLEDGYVDLERHGADRDLHVRADQLSAQGSASYQARGAKVGAQLALEGRMVEPVQGPLRVASSLALDGESGGGAFRGELPGALVDLTGSFAGTESATVQLKEARLAPETARAFVPSYPLRTDATLAGNAVQTGNLVRLDLRAHGAGGEARIEGAYDVARLRTPGLAVHASGIDLAQFLPKAPRSSLSLDLQVQGGGTSLRNLEGRVSLEMPASVVGGEPFGPVRAKATAGGGTLDVSELTAVLPGLRLNATASASIERISASGDLQAKDLAKLARALGHLGGKNVPELSGSGSLHFSASGPARHPGVELAGSFPSLQLGDTSVRSVELSASVPDTDRPLDVDGKLGIGYLKSGERVLRDVSAEVSSQGRQLVVRAASGGALELSLDARGIRDPDSRGVRVDELALSYPGASWKLERPARIELPEGGFSTQPLDLRAGDQRLAVEGWVRGERFEGKVDVERLAIGKLPHILLDPSYELAGTVTASATANGTLSRPSARAHVEVRDGHFKKLARVGLELDASYEDDRAAGKLSVQSDTANVRADFDAPVLGLVRRRREPLRVVVDLDETSVAKLLSTLGASQPAAGVVAGQLVLTGTAREPLATLFVRGRDVRVGDYPPSSLQRTRFELRAHSGDGGRLQAHAELGAAGTAGTVDVRTPLTLGELVAHPPEGRQLREMPVEVDAALQGVPLELLEAFGVPRLNGSANVRAELRGSALEPTLQAAIAVRGAGLPNEPKTDGTVNVVATRERVDASLEAHRGSQKVLELAVALGAPLSKVMDAEALPKVPISAAGTLQPLSIAELVPAAAPTEDQPRPKQASGVVLATLRASGTLEHPRVELRSNVEELRLDQACLGRASIAYDYGDAQSKLHVDLTSVNQGHLLLDAKVGLDLGYPALRRGLAVAQAPLEAKLVSTAFDLGSLSSLVPKVRAIGGLLAANATARGTVGAPALKGDLEWKQGMLALEGYGDFRDAHLVAHATNDVVEIETLTAKSGGGSVTAKATARRSGPAFALEGRAEADQFPIVVDDQLMAIASTRLTFKGDVSNKLVDISDLTIPEAHVELPDIKQKNLQDLDRPDDVVLVRNGRPLHPRKAAPPEPPAAPEEVPGAEAPKPPAGAPELVAAPASGGAGTADEVESPSRKYWFTIHAPRNLWVKSTADDVDAEVGLSDNFRFEYQDVSAVYGELHFLRGRIGVIGRKFDVQRDSSIKFTGPPKRPYLNITAVHVNDREKVTVFVTIRGQGKDFSLKVSSQPPLSETEIYTLLATGRRTLKRGSGASMNTGDAASIVGAWATSKLKSAVAKNLPIDLLVSVESTGEGTTGARFDVGTYLTDKWYMGYSQQIGTQKGAGVGDGENTWGVKLEYQLFPDVSVQGEYGDQKKGADIIWSRDY